MNNATLYVEDIAETASYFADTEGMDDDDLRGVITTICDTLADQTGIDVNWSTDTYSVHGWRINGAASWHDNDNEAALCEELNLAVEQIVNEGATRKEHHMEVFVEGLKDLVIETNGKINWHMTEARKAKASTNNTGNQHHDAAIARRLNREILPIVRHLRTQPA